MVFLTASGSAEKLLLLVREAKEDWAFMDSYLEATDVWDAIVALESATRDWLKTYAEESK